MALFVLFITWYLITDGSDKCYKLLMNAFETMVNMTIQKLLDSIIESQIYPIDPRSLHIKSSVTCTKGMVPVDFRCGLYNEELV
jgi:hypothetical protein